MMAEYIDREALFRDIESSVVFSVRNAPSAEMRGAHKITERIRCAPAADVVEVKHGRWEKSEDDYCGLNIIQCSLCREEWCFECDDDVKGMNYHYCPNCGAKMEEG